MNIAFFGSSLVSSYWNGAATYYRGLLHELAGRGHRVTFYEPDAYERQQHRDIEDPDWAEVVVYPVEKEDTVLAQVESARGADLVVKASGVGVHDALLEAAVLELQDPDTLVIFWDVDAPATLDRLNQNPDDPFRALVSRFDLVLTYGGGAPVVAGYTGHGARQCLPIYNALDPATHYPEGRDGRFAADLGFLGNRLPDREERVEEFFLRPAQAIPHRRFLLGGNGWADKPVPANVHRVGHVGTGDHNRFHGTPTAALNINRESMARLGFSPPTRVFEAVGAEACLITDAWPGIEQFLEPDAEVLVARDGDEVAAHLDALTPARALKIGIAARRRVLREHTYRQRVEQLESVLAAQIGRRALAPRVAL